MIYLIGTQHANLRLNKQLKILSNFPVPSSVCNMHAPFIWSKGLLTKFQVTLNSIFQQFFYPKKKVSTKWPYFLRKICVIFFCELLRIFCIWSPISFAQFFFALNRKYCAKRKFFSQNMFLQIDQNWQFQHRIKQLKVYSKIYIQINYDYAALNWLLLVTKSSN